MLIGTDASINECIATGYMMVCYDARKKSQVNERLDFYRTYGTDNELPYSEPKTVRQLIRACRDTCVLMDGSTSLAELLETYQHNKAGVDSFTGAEYPMDTSVYTIYDILELAQTLDAYCGHFSWSEIPV